MHLDESVKAGLASAKIVQAFHFGMGAHDGDNLFPRRVR